MIKSKKNIIIIMLILGAFAICTYIFFVLPFLSPWKTASERFTDSSFSIMQDVTSFDFHSIHINKYQQMEISLLYSNLKIITHDEEYIYIESMPINLHSFIISKDGSAIYIFDDNQQNINAQLTIYVPINAMHFFKHANIHIENGNLDIIKDFAEESLAETINIS